ncbi:MAG: hypothetical protein CVU59_05725 [Deltaproteobacteria bacterium HGW-Deltaproteobacteria-17]|nr:MAG: hypothetical protein CVU59_05725 [Deltaproteobacteria bacterium HGW-Deltaproteobacteria-17]
MSVDVLELRESSSIELPEERLTEAQALWIEREHGDCLEVRWPFGGSRRRWILTARSMVGHLELPGGLQLHITPKVPLANLFAMLDFVHSDGRELRWYPGEVHVGRIEGLLQLLVRQLVAGVRHRLRLGLYRTYEARSEELMAVRGNIDTTASLRRPSGVRLPCRFEEHTADNAENRILTWTLWVIARGACLGREQRRSVDELVRTLEGEVSLVPCTSKDCVGRVYHRLNEDYARLHGLCRFFLEHMAPAHAFGDRRMLPFLINMPSLFERFVAQSLEHGLAGRFQVKAQQHLPFGESRRWAFRFDLVLRDPATNRVLAVLDTKYKTQMSSGSHDVEQVLAYAAALGCAEAVLVYPVRLPGPLNEVIGASGVRVRQLSLDIGANLAASVEELIANLVEGLATHC